MSEQVREPLIKKMDNIVQTFKTINRLLTVKSNVNIIHLFLSTLTPCHKLQLWRNPSGWSINHKYQAKQNYRGLVNPGCICYMNSLLQQLFMIDQFRLALLELDTTPNDDRLVEERSSSLEVGNRMIEEGKISSDVLMLQGLKQLFLKLMFSEENNINPTSFARTLKINDTQQKINLN